MTTGDWKRREARQNGFENWLQGPKLVFRTKIKCRAEVTPGNLGRRSLVLQKKRVGLAGGVLFTFLG